MKKFILLIAMMAAALVPLTGMAGVGGGYILNASGSVKIQGDETTNKAVVTSLSFNEKYIYTLISNALANASGTLGPNLTPVIVPTDGYIASDAYGDFYVTNKTGSYYPLSGEDAVSNYYSFIELDTYLFFGDTFPSSDYDLGYGEDASDLVSYSLSKTGAGSGIATSTAVLYIHDAPYAYDDFDDPDNFFLGNQSSLSEENENAIEIRGVLTAQLKYPGANTTPAITSYSITGSGNALINGAYYLGIETSGKATLAP